MEILSTILWLAVGFGCGWLTAKARTLNDYNAMYSHLTAQIISRMTDAMRSLCMKQQDIDEVVHRMGCKIMPPAVPPPPAPPTMDERLKEQKLCMAVPSDMPEADKDIVGCIALRCAKMLHNAASRGDMHELELITNSMGLEWMQRTPTMMVGKRTKVSYNVTNYAEDGIVVLFGDIVKD
jgi:hypothetical protein